MKQGRQLRQLGRRAQRQSGMESESGELDVQEEQALGQRKQWQRKRHAGRAGRKEEEVEEEVVVEEEEDDDGDDDDEIPEGATAGQLRHFSLELSGGTPGVLLREPMGALSAAGAARASQSSGLQQRLGRLQSEGRELLLFAGHSRVHAAPASLLGTISRSELAPSAERMYLAGRRSSARVVARDGASVGSHR